MQPIFSNSKNLEIQAKNYYSIPDFLMMENAATEICNLIRQKIPENHNKTICILCGKGNNGGDGFAVARKLQEYYNIKIFIQGEPEATEAEVQYEMCKKLNLNFTDSAEFSKSCISADVLLDCLYGTGFHGELNSSDKLILDAMNGGIGLKVACDIPSGLYFSADYTVTMGVLKTELFSDKAKAMCGKIVLVPLGISTQKFTAFQTPAAFLLEINDIKLPLRHKKSVHKGNFGHSLVFAGDKSGAGIIGAEAALNFGAGFSTICKTDKSNLNQFKISPELMIADNSIPERTSSIQIGSGLGNSPETIKLFESWFTNTKNPACVIDADMFNYPYLKSLLQKLNAIPNSRIVLTPHHKELERLLEKLNLDSDSKLEIADFFSKEYNNITLVMKGANTFIVSEGNIFICNDGNQSLAKAGSGDVLAGLINGLLAQGYSAKDAAITAVMVHALASSSIQFKDNYSLTPEKLIAKISDFKL